WGTVAFWFEHFQPDKHVALDIKAREDSAYFQRYLSATGLQQKIRTFWKTDQANSSRLREIATEEFDGPLDRCSMTLLTFMNRPGRVSRRSSLWFAQVAFTSSKIGDGRT